MELWRERISISQSVSYFSFWLIVIGDVGRSHADNTSILIKHRFICIAFQGRAKLRH